MRTVVDTSAILALLYPDDAHYERAASMLRDASADGAVLVNPVVYAELAADDTFDSREAIEYFLEDTGIEVEALGSEVAHRAGTAFQSYLSRRGTALECPACGVETTVDCPECGRSLSARQHVAADFLIGAHAETADQLLTFDQGFFRDYFDVTVQSISK